MRYILKHGDKFVSFIHWVAIYNPNLRYVDDINEALVLSRNFLDKYEEKVGKTRLELIKEDYPDIEVKAVNIVLV